jgi:hypothetical protein
MALGSALVACTLSWEPQRYRGGVASADASVDGAGDADGAGVDASADGVNLLRNGDFEESVTACLGWQGASSLESGRGRNRTAACRVSRPFGEFVSLSSDHIDRASFAGERYRIEAWARTADGEANPERGYAALIQYRDGVETRAASTSWTVIVGSEWTHVSASYSLASDGTELAVDFRFVLPDGGGGVLIDDAVIAKE